MILVMEKDRTADEWSKLFVLCCTAGTNFAIEKRPALVKRAFIKSRRYSMMAINARSREMRVSAPSPKSAELIFRKSRDQVIHELLPLYHNGIQM